MIKFNLRQVTTFVGVYESGSFSKAAKRLNATQSALSMQIQNLERSIGVPLFERSAKGVVPTSAARKFYDRVVSVLRDLDAAALEASGNAGNLTGRLRIGLMPTFTRGVFAPALKSFLAEFPNVEVSVVEAYSAVLTEGVAAGQFDFAIVPSAPHRDGIRSR